MQRHEYKQTWIEKCAARHGKHRIRALRASAGTMAGGAPCSWRHKHRDENAMVHDDNRTGSYRVAGLVELVYQ